MTPPAARFTDGLIAAAEQDANLTLVDLQDLAAGLSPP